MSAPRPSPRTRPAAVERAAGGTVPERVYDSFVVRLWREAGGRRLVRAEVEHIQSGRVVRAWDVTLGWVVRCIASCLSGHEAGQGSRFDSNEEGQE
jgi:hypothetical protein